MLSFKYYVEDEGILANVLQEKLKVVHNHKLGLAFTSEWSNFDLFSQISVYFLTYHSQLNQCLQNGQWTESAWWSPLQLEHLNEWEQGSPFLVSSLGGLVLSLALQHQLNSLWCSDLWGLLHLTHFAPWILHDKVAWPHFQQFLQSGMPEFMFAPLMVVMKFSTLKHLLMSIFAFLPLWTSQMSIQTKAISDFREILITLGFKAREMLLNI